MTSKVMGHKKCSGTAALTGILQTWSLALSQETPAIPIQPKKPVGQTRRSAVLDEVERADLSPRFWKAYYRATAGYHCCNNGSADTLGQLRFTTTGLNKQCICSGSLQVLDV